MMAFRDVKSKSDMDRWQDFFEQASIEEKTEILADMTQFLKEWSARFKKEPEGETPPLVAPVRRHRFNGVREANGLKRVRGNSRRR